MLEIIPTTVPVAAAATVAAGFFARARFREAAKRRDYARQQLRRLQIDALDLARSADQHRSAEEARRSRVLELEAEVETLRVHAAIPSGIEALRRRERRRLEVLRPTDLPS